MTNILFIFVCIMTLFVWCAYYSCYTDEFWCNNFREEINKLKQGRALGFVGCIIGLFFMSYFFIPSFGIWVGLNGIIQECEGG